jgi:hypothetical protein
MVRRAIVAILASFNHFDALRQSRHQLGGLPELR